MIFMVERTLGKGIHQWRESMNGEDVDPPWMVCPRATMEPGCVMCEHAGRHLQLCTCKSNECVEVTDD
jgi:hypothetical protein